MLGDFFFARFYRLLINLLILTSEKNKGWKNGRVFERIILKY